MLEYISTIYTDFLSFSKDNPVASGVISLWGLGILTFFLKVVPLAIFRFIKRQLTTTLTLNSQDDVFYDFLRWAGKNKMHSFVRSLNLNNSSRFGFGDAVLTIGYGSTLLRFKGRILIFSRRRDEANQTDKSKEIITLTLIGRNHKVFNELFSTIKEQNNSTEHFRIYKFEDKRWITLSRQYKRSLDTVILPSDTKNRLIHHIDSFYNSKSWYINNGIPYRTGILLQGPPGTGKTSLIKAICAKYERDLYLINLQSTSDNELLSALSRAPEGAIIAIEDIDTANLSNRGNIIKEKDDKGTIKADMGISTLGGVLNAIDGVASNEDRIIIATTNYPERLDPALIREGRFDLKLDIGYMTNETLKKYISRFYPNKNLNHWNILPKISPSKVQKLIFEYKEQPNKVLKEIASVERNIFPK